MRNINPSLLKTFQERVRYLLCYIYDHGGAEYKDNDFNSNLSYGIVELNNGGEFESLMDALASKHFITTGGVTKSIGGGIFYHGVRLTEHGIDEAERHLPQQPMFGLVSQEITTGDPSVDSKINHAKGLFYSVLQTMDNMRSACEALSFVLEPLREELSKVISVGDVNVFFELINKFDIRHNKEHTKNIAYEEQLEWVFYSLLNSINTYTKLKARLLLF